MESILLLVILVVLIILGAPVGFTLILIPVVYILITDAAPMILIPSQMFSAIDSVPLTAIFHPACCALSSRTGRVCSSGWRVRW